MGEILTVHQAVNKLSFEELMKQFGADKQNEIEFELFMMKKQVLPYFCRAQRCLKKATWESGHLRYCNGHAQVAKKLFVDEIRRPLRWRKIRHHARPRKKQGGRERPR